jgi:hypothetical protein
VTASNAMTDIERLLAIEEIKQLKAKYFLGIDTKDWALWRDEVWAEAAVLDVPSMNHTARGRDALIAWVAAQSADQVSVHHGHMPIITLTSNSTATGLWAMEDLIWRSPGQPLNGEYAQVHGWGHYHEEYVRQPEGWRILSTRLTRLRVEYTKVG